MNYRMAAAALMGILMVSPIGSSRADEPLEPPTKAEKPHWDSGKMKEKLGLSDDQAAKLKSIRESERDAMKPLWDKQRDLMKKLDSQVKAKAGDTEIQATLDDLAANRKATRDQFEQFRSQREALLTPTQRAKFILMQMKHRPHKGSKHGHQGDKETPNNDPSDE